MLISAGAINPSVTIARCHVPSLSQLSTVSTAIATMVSVAIYGAAHDCFHSDWLTCSDFIYVPS